MDDKLYTRIEESIIGIAAESQPQFMGKPVFPAFYWMAVRLSFSKV
jgi:hypothetical protein